MRTALLMSVDEFHRETGGRYGRLSDDEVREIIETLTVLAELVCDCVDAGGAAPVERAS